MKKLSLLFLLLTAFVFVGCSDDDKAPDYSVALTSDKGVISVSVSGLQDLSQAKTSVNVFRGETQLAVATGTPTEGFYTIAISEVSGGTAAVSSNEIAVNSLTSGSTKVVVTLNINIENISTVTKTYTAEVEDVPNEQLITFEGKLTEAESEFVSESTIEDGYYFADTFQDNGKLLTFKHLHSEWGFAAFTYMNRTEDNLKEKSATPITKKGKVGTTYLCAFASEWTPAEFTINSPQAYRLKGAWVTNSAYAYNAMTTDKINGATPFKKDSWFKLTATGRSNSNTVTGTADIYLANYTSDTDKPVDEWIWFDMSGLGDAVKVVFSLSSTDEGEFGMNTPSYFCMDGITLEEK